MSLLDRLKPEYKKMLKNEELRYPLSVKHLQTELADANHWVGLKYSSIVNLATYLNTYDYSPTGIDNLFSDEEH